MRDDEALAEQSRALELDPSHRDARYERVVLTAAFHRRRAEQLMALGGGARLEADAEARTLREAMAADVARLGDNVAARGLLALAQGDRARARELLSSAPGSEEVRAALAAIALFDGAFEESVRLWTDAVASDRGFATHRQGRGFARVAWGYAAAHRGEDPAPHYTAAIADLDAAIERAPNVAQAWTHRGLARFLWMDDLEHTGGDGAELYRQALADFDRAIALRKEESRAWLWRGIMRSRRAAAVGARGRDGLELQHAGLADVEEAVRLSGSADESRMWRGVVRAGWGFLEILRGADPGSLLDDALVDLDGAPSWRAMCRFARAMRPGASAAAELAAAMEDAEAGVKAAPESAEAYARRGTIRLARGEDAVADFETAIQRNGRRVESWIGLGRAHAQRRDLARALDAFARAESLNRSNALVWQYRGQAREAWSVVKQDERAAAAREYEEAARLNPWLERVLRERIERLRRP
jgi:tetratricopeptide (TPR) repeat protein